MMRSLAIFLVAVAPAVSCVGAPALRKPDAGAAVPERWTADDRFGEGSVGASWWTDFDDPDLDRLILEALEHNHDLRAAGARVDAAVAAARIAGADLVPSVSLSLTGNRRKQNFIGFPIPGSEDDVLSTTFTTFGVSVDTAWEADLWGRIRAGKAAALAELEASQVDLEAARLSIAGQTAKAWFAVAEARRQKELAEATVDSYRLTADRVRSRYEKGIRPSLDYRLAESNLAQAEAIAELRRSQLQRAVRQLEVLVGRYPAGLLEHGSLPSPPDRVPGGLPATLVSRRPDLVAAERRLAAADARVAQARAALYPGIRLTASGGTSTRELKDLVDGDFSVWSLAAGILQPLFQGGRLRAGVDVAEARSRESAERFAQAALRAYQEVEATLADEHVLARQEEALAVAAEQATKAARLAEDRYEAGLEEIVTVLDAQRRALLTESELLAVRRLRLDNRLDLYLALGGGFDASESADPAKADQEFPSS